MSQSKFTALLKKLDWQAMQIEQRIEALRAEKEQVTKTLEAINQGITDACVPAKQILPEQEMARLGFLNQQMQLSDQEQQKMKTIDQAIEKQQEQLTAIKTQQKTIEKFMTRQTLKAVAEFDNAQEKQLEDLLLARRNA